MRIGLVSVCGGSFIPGAIQNKGKDESRLLGELKSYFRNQREKVASLTSSY